MLVKFFLDSAKETRNKSLILVVLKILLLTLFLIIDVISNMYILNIHYVPGYVLTAYITIPSQIWNHF